MFPNRALVRNLASAVILLLICPCIASAQKISDLLYIQFTSGISTYKSNTSIDYKIKCPELKFGLGIIKNWNRFGVSSSVLTGIRFSTYLPAPYSSNPVQSFDETYIYTLYQGYTSKQVLLEIPATAHYYLIENILSLHSGFSYRRNLTKSTTNFRDPNNPSSLGILSMIHLSPVNNLTIGLDYFVGLGKLNRTNIAGSGKEYYAKGSYFQFSLFYKALNKRSRVNP